MLYFNPFVNFVKTLCAPLWLMPLALLFSLSLSSQNILVQTFTTSDSILIRWAPSNAEVWKAGNQFGYTIERFTADQYLDLAGQNPDGKGTLLNSSPILPAKKNDSLWNVLMKKDKQNMLVYDAIYGTAPPANSASAKMKFGMALKAADLSVETAKASGLYFADKTAQPGQLYVYRIRIANAGKNYNGIANTAGANSVLHAPEKISGAFTNKRAQITFDVQSTRAEYAGYIIERSEDSIHFQRINQTLFVFAVSQYEQKKTEAVYADTLPQNGKTYWYRVRGYSYFGMNGPASAAVKGKGKNEWLAYPEIDTLYSPENKTASMRWHVADSLSKFVDRFLILRSGKADGKFVQIGTSKTTTFSDPSPAFASYYKIVALNAEQDSAFSFPYFLELKDNEAPPVPSGISGTIDTNGIVHLHWENVSASDLKGYRVFCTNDLRQEFFEVTDSVFTGNNFTDTLSLQTLTRNVFYSVRSVDRMYNNSANSKPVRLLRPDKVSPVPAVVKSVFHTDTSVVLSWINSSSDDILRMELIRKNDNRVLFSSNGNDTLSHFTDRTAIPGTVYSYSILITDSSGNKSVTDFPAIAFLPRIYPALKNFKGEVNREKRVVNLSWEKPAQEVDRYIIYKTKANEPMRSWKTISGKQNFISDTELYPGNEYRYYVKAVLKNGAETKIAEVKLEY